MSNSTSSLNACNSSFIQSRSRRILSASCTISLFSITPLERRNLPKIAYLLLTSCSDIFGSSWGNFCSTFGLQAQGGPNHVGKHAPDIVDALVTSFPLRCSSRQRLTGWVTLGAATAYPNTEVIYAVQHEKANRWKEMNAKLENTWV